jgi:hypothetical protein
MSWSNLDRQNIARHLAPILRDHPSITLHQVKRIWQRRVLMTDLESEIDTLRDLDNLRVESEQLRKEGIEVLTTILAKGYKYKDSYELARVSMTFWELASAPPAQLNKWKEELEHLELADIVDKHPCPILLAAQILQALAAAPSFAFSKSSLYSYYLIVRELYTADAPDWAVGGARANSKDGMVSAYVTRECVRAIRSLARVLERTSDLIAKVGAIQQRSDLLQTSFPELKQWVLTEEARLKFDLHTTIQIFSRHLVFQPLTPLEPEAIDIDTVIGAIASQLKDAARNAHANFTNALEDIEKFRKDVDEVLSKTDEKEESRFLRAEPGHRAAVSALTRGLAATAELIKLFNSSGPYAKFTNWEQLKEGVKDPTKKIYEGLHPARNFLSSVLNRQLAAATGGSYGGWDVVEMACSGAAYGAVTNEWDDDRLHRVADSLKQVVSERGWFPIGRPFLAAARGFAVPDNTASMGALAQILKNTGIRAQHLKRSVAIPIEQTFVRKMLYFFKETRADKPPVDMVWETKGEMKYGWSSDYGIHPCATEPLATARAVQLLGLLNQMLDEQINAQILCHFFVRRPEQLELERGPNLGTLFYPDYGLSLAPPRIARKKEHSIAIVLQKMRAHVCSEQDLDTLYSLVLHGPQGTGKTTIVEALALSCEMPLVEVTPSDIVVKGQEAVERRARAVFEALSLLTRVVILFDEFDPVLWRREPKIRPKDVFAFLIPGMLPKLRMLYKTAKRRSGAYVLITNLIGSLDEPTIREGRFDEKIGIYPPDLLSRCGRFWSEAADLLMKEDPPKDPKKALNDKASKERLKSLLTDSAGAGMQALNRQGWFTRSLHYYIGDNKYKPDAPGKDAHLEGVNGIGPLAEFEYLQWAWSDGWDITFNKQCEEGWEQGFKELEKPTTPEPKLPGLWYWCRRWLKTLLRM